VSLAYFAFYPNDFIGATCHLSNEQAGAYIKILCFLWQKERSKENYLKAVGFGSVSVGLNDWEPVAELLQIDENGMFYNRRLEEERIKATKKHEAQVNNGKKGGRPKKIKPNESQNKPMANPQAKPIESNHNHNHNHKEIKEIESVGSLEVYEDLKNDTHAQNEISFSSNYPSNSQEVVDYAYQFCGKFKPHPERCIEFYEFWRGSGWADSNNKPINWKQKISYFLRDYKQNQPKEDKNKNTLDFLQKHGLTGGANAEPQQIY
jgi:uncharacterized protein YdaU (DUF1376 family)